MESDSDLDLALIIYYRERVKKRKRKRRRFWLHSTISQRDAFGEYHTLVQELRHDNERFRMYFRMSVTAFDYLLSLVEPYIMKENTSYRRAITPGERLAITLRLVQWKQLFSKNFLKFRSLSFRFLKKPKLSLLLLPETWALFLTATFLFSCISRYDVTVCA